MSTHLVVVFVIKMFITFRVFLQATTHGGSKETEIDRINLLASPSLSPSLAPTTIIYQMFTVAGNGPVGSAPDNAVATLNGINQPFGVFLDSTGDNLHFADNVNCRVREIDLPNGISTVVAGTTVAGGLGDGGQASSAQLNSPRGICGTTSGTVFVSDFIDQKIRKITSNGIISTHVGTGTASTVATAANGDGGRASSATLWAPYFTAIDTSDNLYIVEFSGWKLRKVTANTNIISTVTGNGVSANTGDGGRATAASIYAPWGVYVDFMGVVYVSCNGNIWRSVALNGIISTFAGKTLFFLIFIGFNFFFNRKWWNYCGRKCSSNGHRL